MGATQSLDFLDPHQRQGIDWILEHKRTYLAHAPGAGKTCQAIIASLLARGRGQTLFVVPPTLTKNWEREILLWYGSYQLAKRFELPTTEGEWPSIFVVPGSDKKENVDWGADYIICPDSMLSKTWVWQKLAAKEFKFIAIDEASRFKEMQTLRTIDLFSILKRSKGHVVLLDGSPTPNGRPMELYAPLIALRPDVIDNMNEHEFGVKFCNGRFIHTGYKQAWDYRGSSHEDELRARLQKNFMHVVTEDELEHPERRRSLLFTNEHGSLLKEFSQRLLKTIRIKDIDEDMSRGQIASYRQMVGLSKIDFVVKYVGERIENKNESILLFAWHRDVCTGLATRLKRYKPALVIGNTPDGEREDAFARFQRNDCKLIVGNIAAMGRGHNLQNADRVVFAEYSWGDETNKQAEKRASRKGSKKQVVRCDYVVVPNSLDEVVLNAVMNKAKITKRIIG